MHKGTKKADDFALNLYPLVKQYQARGYSLRGIAAKFNFLSLKTSYGKRGSWGPQTVKNVIERAEKCLTPPSDGV